MNVPLVDLKAQYAAIGPEVDEAIKRVLVNTSFILGKEVADFEAAFAKYVNAESAVGVASGTAALHLALAACGVGPGDEVITPSHTFAATAEPIVFLGAKPVFVDIDPVTFNMHPNLVEKAVTSRTKAILPVHIYGHPFDADAIMDIAEKHRLFVIEDAAQAHGAEYKGRRAGSLGDLACFSFYPGKNLGAYGDAGAVTGNNPELIDKVKKLRNHGRSGKYEHDIIGYGERIDALHAAILNAKLPHLEAWTESRRKNAGIYNELLKDLPVKTPAEMDNVRHVYHLFVIRVERRDSLLEHLKNCGIGAGIHYPIPLHKQPSFMKLGLDFNPMPVTERIADEIVSLPLYPELTPDKIEYVVEKIREFYK